MIASFLAINGGKYMTRVLMNHIQKSGSMNWLDGVGRDILLASDIVSKEISKFLVIIN